MVADMKYFVFDSGIELIITSDKSLKDKSADVCSCVGDLTSFIEYVKIAIDDGCEHDFFFDNGEKFSGDLCSCLEYVAKKRA